MAGDRAMAHYPCSGEWLRDPGNEGWGVCADWAGGYIGVR